MAKIKFTALSIQNLQSGNKSLEFFDTDRENGSGAFGIRVSPKGKKVWFLMYKAGDGKIKRFTLGTYPAMNLKNARAKANKTASIIHDGGDPQQTKTDYKQSPTMSDLWEEYQLSLSRNKKQKAESNRLEEIRKWKTDIEPAIGSLKVMDVKKSHLSVLLNKIADRAPVAANRTFSLLQIIFKVALNKDWIDVHPMFMMNRPGGSEVARKRILTNIEIINLWYLFDNEPQGDIFKLGLMTAARPGEIMSMKWTDVDFEKTVWHQQNTKNGNDNLVPLSPHVLDILLKRDQSTKYVFPAKRGDTEHSKCLKATRVRLQKESRITGWTNHDLRRTARTILSRLNIDQHIRERVLNHTQGGVTGVYDQYDYLPEKRIALDALAKEISAIINSKDYALEVNG